MTEAFFLQEIGNSLRVLLMRNALHLADLPLAPFQVEKKQLAVQKVEEEVF
jgi:hypothetical protein